MITSRSLQNTLKTALSLIKDGDLNKAHDVLENILQNDLENQDVLYTLKSVNFWMDKFRLIAPLESDFERGEYVISQWEAFLLYLRRQNEHYIDYVLYAFKHCVFGLALHFYLAFAKEDVSGKSPESLRKIGLCYKALGDYEMAIKFLNKAMEENENSPAICAELADSYALCGEIRISKLFFREAFFKGVSEIEIKFLESDVIWRLINETRSKGFRGEELMCWVPVYGVINGVLNVKRELRAIEHGQLKQKIYLLENEIITSSENDRKIIIPRLIYYYFWLIDHYVNIHEDQFKIDGILLKIKMLNEEIYGSIK